MAAKGIYSDKANSTTGNETVIRLTHCFHISLCLISFFILYLIAVTDITKCHTTAHKTFMFNKENKEKELCS